MSIVSTRCTSCGANININDDERRNACEYCGQAYIVQKSHEKETAVGLVCAKCKSESIQIDNFLIRLKVKPLFIVLCFLFMPMSFGISLFLLVLALKRGQRERKVTCRKCGFVEIKVVEDKELKQ